jgi:hypothetical protein
VFLGLDTHQPRRNQGFTPNNRLDLFKGYVIFNKERPETEGEQNRELEMKLGKE